MTESGRAAINLYKRTRDRTERAIAALRPQMEAWLEAHETGELNLMDLAQLEALNGERERLGQDITDAQTRLIESLRRRVVE